MDMVSLLPREYRALTKIGPICGAELAAFLSRGFGDFVGLGGFVLIERESSVALAKEAALQKSAETLRQSQSMAAFSRDHATGNEKRGRPEQGKDTGVLPGFLVTGGEENEIEWRVSGIALGGE